MDIRIEGLLSSLRLRHIHALFAENSADACQKVMGLIPPDAVVGIGDSTTMRQLGIPQALKDRGIRVLDPFEPNGPGKDPEERLTSALSLSMKIWGWDGIPAGRKIESNTSWRITKGEGETRGRGDTVKRR